MTPFAAVRGVTLCALFAIPLLPLYVDKGLYFPFVAGRGFAFRMLAEIALAGWAVLALGDRRYRPRLSWIWALFALLVAWMAVADAVAMDPHKAFWGNFERMEGWVTLAHLFAFFVVAGAMLAVEGLWKAWWLTFVGVSALVCGHGLGQAARLLPLHGPAGRVDANFGNPEFLAGYLLFALALTLWLAVTWEGKRRLAWRCALCGLAALQVVTLVATGTRGALAGLVAAVVFGALSWRLGSGGRGRPAAPLALAGLVVPAGVLIGIRQGLIAVQNPILARFAHMGVEDLEVRFALWRIAWKGFLARPITGWGQEGFAHAFNRFYEPSLAREQPWFDRAHNLYLDWLVAGGAPALGLVLAILGSTVLALHRGPHDRAGRILLISALVAYGVQGLVVFDNLLTVVPLAALLAFVHSAGFGTVERAPGETTWRAPPAVIPVAALSSLAVLWLVNVPTLRSGHDLMRVLNPPAGEPMRLGYFKRALDQGGFATEEIHEKLGQVALVVAGATEAPEADRRSFALYAIEQLNAELQQAPHAIRLRLALAKLYRVVGDRDAAARQVAAALAEAPKHPAPRAAREAD